MRQAEVRCAERSSRPLSKRQSSILLLRRLPTCGMRGDAKGQPGCAVTVFLALFQGGTFDVQMVAKHLFAHSRRIHRLCSGRFPSKSLCEMFQAAAAMIRCMKETCVCVCARLFNWLFSCNVRRTGHLRVLCMSWLLNGSIR